jgi:hypothetical protein
MARRDVFTGKELIIARCNSVAQLFDVFGVADFNPAYLSVRGVCEVWPPPAAAGRLGGVPGRLGGGVLWRCRLLGSSRNVTSPKLGSKLFSSVVHVDLLSFFGYNFCNCVAQGASAMASGAAAIGAQTLSSAAAIGQHTLNCDARIDDCFRLRFVNDGVIVTVVCVSLFL